MSIQLRRGLAAAFVLGGCGAGSGSEGAPLGACAAALSSEQGTRLQAASLQGTRMQGLELQGTRLQGVSLQGISPQGLSPQGLSPQGLSPQGISPQGISSQGFSPQGISPQGVGRQGFSAQGTSLNGAGLEGSALTQVRLELREGELVATLGERALLRGSELRGARLPFTTDAGETLWVEIARAERRGEQERGWLYALELEGRALCDGDGLGAFVPGVWDETGRHLPALEAAGRTLDATFSCRAGVIAKCVFWGYDPASVGPELHQACTRMARADYCGDGIAHTEEGTLIDLFDPLGIQSPVEGDELSFEAGWGSEGAVCVHQPRYIDLTLRGQLDLPSCWGERPRCETWEKARELGASLGNDSAHTVRSASCESR